MSEQYVEAVLLTHTQRLVDEQPGRVLPLSSREGRQRKHPRKSLKAQQKAGLLRENTVNPFAAHYMGQLAAEQPGKALLLNIMERLAVCLT